MSSAFFSRIFSTMAVWQDMASAVITSPYIQHIKQRWNRRYLIAFFVGRKLS
jgi:uncharacterized membrane protein YjjP (DUF1212 family)